MVKEINLQINLIKIAFRQGAMIKPDIVKPCGYSRLCARTTRKAKMFVFTVCTVFCLHSYLVILVPVETRDAGTFRLQAAYAALSARQGQ